MNLTDYAKYGMSICTSTTEGVEYYMVTLTYGKKWSVQQPAGNMVMCAKIRVDGTYCYMTEAKNGVEPIFELIDDTIRYNEELEKKVELLKVKAEELKDVFATRSYDELLMLRFVIETPQETPSPKNKRQSNSRRKTPQKPNTEATEAKLETQPEPVGEPVQNVVPEQPNTTEASDIDKKIAAAMSNKN